MRTICILLLLFILFSGKKENELKPISSRHLRIPEPSDICTGSGNTYFIVSDNGRLFKTDDKFNVIMEASQPGFDFEGVVAVDSNVIVSDESLRQAISFDQGNLKRNKQTPISYNGGRNLGFESITYLKDQQNFIAFTEKDPCLFTRFDKDFKILDQHSVDGISEVSAITYYENFLWILSDDEMTIYKTDPVTLNILQSWKLSILNPEGICFSHDGKLLIVSDDLAKLFEFEFPH